MRSTLHLDEPLPAQYARFVRGLATLDLGDSLRRPGTRAMARVGDALGPTAELAAVAVGLGAVVGIAAALAASGPWLAPRARLWVERVLVGVAAAPLVAFAPVVTWALAARLRIVPLPGDPDAGPAGLLFASGLLAIPLAAHVGRIARAALGEMRRAPFLLVASAKGARAAARLDGARAAGGCMGPSSRWLRRSSARSSEGLSCSSACSSVGASAR